jgi:hypothetical protein
MQAIGGPLVWILLLAGIADGFSDNWVHGGLLCGSGLVVWWYARHAGPALAPPAIEPVRRAAGGRRRVVTLLVAGIAFSTVFGALERYTWPVTLAVSAAGIAGLALAWRGGWPMRDRAVPPPAARAGAAAWAVVLIAGGLWELGALLLQPSLLVSSYEHPTISFLMDSVLAGPAGRMVTLAVWLAFGWFLLAQAGRSRR